MKKLTDGEFEVLEKIAEKSGMDCWFYIEQNEQGDDVVFDLEENKTLNLEDGISMLDDGITDLDDYDLSEDEKNCYINLMYKIALKNSMPIERLSVLLYNALVILEESNDCRIIGSDLEEEIGITQEEYDCVVTKCDKFN